MKIPRIVVLGLLLAGLLVPLAACEDEGPGASAQRNEPEPQPEDEPEPEPEKIPEPEAVDLPVIPVGVETLLSLSEVRAGESVDVTCRVHDASGMTLEADEGARVQITHSPGGSLVADEVTAQRFTATRAGQGVLTCAYPSMGLIDETPAELTILPGAPAQVIAELDRNLMQAGEVASVTCSVFDAYGNAIEGVEARVVTDPAGEGVSVEGGSLSVTRAGLYTVACQVDGASDQVADALEVLPAAPAAMALAKVPEQEVYGLGQVVTFDTVVTDRFANVIEGAAVAVGVTPSAVAFGQARFRFDAEGRYAVFAEVTGETEGGQPVTAEATVIVNGQGPQIRCLGPADGAMLDMRPGDNVTFRARVTDVNGVSSVRVNNQSSTLAEDNTISQAITTVFGINFAEVVATDGFGEQSSRTCAFLVSDEYIGEGQFLDEAVSLRLAQAAIDDTSRSGGLNSLADLLHTMLNSQGMETTLDGALRGASPFIDQCVQDVCLPFVGCSCVFRLRVDYRDLNIGGPQDVALSLVDGGLRAVATVRDVRLNIGIGGTVSTSGSATVSSLTLDMTFNMSMQNNRPRISLRAVNSVNVGSVSTNFSGLAGFVIDILVSLFEGTVRDLIRDQIRNYVRDSFNQILDGVVSGLDISGLGTTFNVPKLGGGTIPVGFGLRFSSLATNTSRALFGLGLRFSGPVNRGGTTLGAPRPSGAVLLDPTTTRSVAAGVHIGALGQVLHVLWRAGMFDATLDGATFGAPAEISATLNTALPPVIESVGGGKVRLTLGAMQVSLLWPGFFDEPLNLTLGAVAESDVSLVNGEELRFGGIVLQRLVLSSDSVALDPVTGGILEDFFRRLLQSVIDNALNNALPALPIPAFALPDSLNTFGIPRGTELGLISPALTISGTHFILQGNFGSR